MDDQALEVRHAMHQAATSALVVKIDEPTAIDPYVRESDALVKDHLSRDECIHRVELCMGLEYDGTQSNDKCAVFPIVYSQKYRALHVNLVHGKVSGHSLVALAADVSDNELDA